mmetsp:Transcript_32749/g.66910  ORF Transcript_32749/g.66910 Transcript_32749/m.66910 type:complete len:242 (-) Transcript_32749:1044-1769(-)
MMPRSRTVRWPSVSFASHPTTFARFVTSFFANLMKFSDIASSSLRTVSRPLRTSATPFQTMYVSSFSYADNNSTRTSGFICPAFTSAYASATRPALSAAGSVLDRIPSARRVTIVSVGNTRMGTSCPALSLTQAPPPLSGTVTLAVFSLMNTMSDCVPSAVHVRIGMHHFFSASSLVNSDPSERNQTWSNSNSTESSVHFSPVTLRRGKPICSVQLAINSPTGMPLLSSQAFQRSNVSVFP